MNTKPILKQWNNTVPDSSTCILGIKKKVTMTFHASLVNVVFDRFGLDVKIHKQNDGWFTITENITVSPTFFAWVLQFGDKAKILSPGFVKK